MAIFNFNEPVETAKPFVRVENKLKAGDYIFQLVVEDEQGNRSKPSSIVVQVRDQNFVFRNFTRL